jgi:hypothetical protein
MNLSNNAQCPQIAKLKIIWLSNILVLSVLHEDCSRNALCARTTFNTYVFIRTIIDIYFLIQFTTIH